MQTPTPVRAAELEKLLRRLRQRADNPKANRLIDVVLIRLSPVFRARNELSDWRHGQYRLYSEA